MALRARRQRRACVLGDRDAQVAPGEGRGAEVQRCRGAEVQGVQSRGAEVQTRRSRRRRSPSSRPRPPSPRGTARSRSRGCGRWRGCAACSSRPPRRTPRTSPSAPRSCARCVWTLVVCALAQQPRVDAVTAVCVTGVPRGAAVLRAGARHIEREVVHLERDQPADVRWAARAHVADVDRRASAARHGEAGGSERTCRRCLCPTRSTDLQSVTVFA